ncbi:DUF2628 domain-containing protein [Bergeriella denitrificans]|uniref:Putative lipoprotein n=1 Tax=Bergeriella denitrificans TaxID=494 RepID=A0A378UEP1_BERDE|nr:DUF2628 domain-containing protein [Bergeriella denitrificans]STZ75660.1 putative lipoprotein [Bergeriella denitrificans]
MKQYTIYEHAAEQRIEAVKNGWSWPGFFFSIFWALFKRLWLVALALFLVAFAASFVGAVAAIFFAGSTQEENAVIDAVGNAASLAIAIYTGINGNSLRERNLLKRGYQRITTVEASSPQHAVARYAADKNA